ncbi:MAG: hypothetical protein RLY11_1072 [Bacteroidota bacterium]
MLRAVLYLLSVVFSYTLQQSVSAQTIQKNSYFSYPLSIKPKLNANFGEMRPNHFHMGLDLYTEAKENLPVYAPADGYISRLKIEKGGFGRAIYINHPNGTTTVYAHMNKFLSGAESYLEKKQYEQETWKIDLPIPPGMIKVQKGQIIGYSGNTGASEGPHVHFEVRDSKSENCLNPLLYGISLNDHIAPDLYQLAFYDYEKSLYEQSPVLVGLVKKGSSYSPVKKIELPFEKVIVGIVAKDRSDGAANPNGIFQATLKKDGRRVAGFRLENISYDFTRNLNGHIDFSLRSRGGPYVQLVYQPKFFPLNIYSSTINKPYLQNETIFQGYELEVTDAHFNVSSLSFDIRKNGLVSKQVVTGQQMVIGKQQFYEEGGVQFNFPADAFYDSFHMYVVASNPTNVNEISKAYQVVPSSVPVNNYFTLKIKPSLPLGNIDTGRVVVRRTYKSSVDIKKASYSKEGFTVSFRDFGEFQLLQDLEAPTIISSVSNGASIKTGTQINFTVSDNLKSIRSFDARVDGKWIMFYPRGNQYVYKVDEHFPKGEHLLSVVVYDEAGNSSRISKQLIKN